MLTRLSLLLSLVLSFYSLNAQSIWLEAECGKWIDQWSLQVDKLIPPVTHLEAQSPAYLNQASSTASQHLRFDVEVPYAGNYGLFARIKALDPSSNSVWLRHNNSNWIKWDNIALSPLPDNTQSGLPVIPNAQGYGIQTPAGRGGQVYKVTNLDDSGPGSLRECVQANGPRVCVFEVGGFINLQSPLAITQPYITIAGQTAPSPGIMLGKGHGIQIYTHDVLLQHLSVRPGDQANGTTFRNRDAVQLNGEGSNKRVYNVVLDHVTMAWGMDENLDLWGYLGEVTVRNCIIAQAMRDPFEQAGTPSYGNLIGPFDQQAKVSIYNSYYAGNRDRQPLSRAAHLIFANNVLYDRVLRFVYLSNRPHNGSGGFATNSSIVGNVFVDGPDMSYSLPKERPINFDPTGQLNASRVFLRDNWWSVQNYSNPWDYIRNASPQLEASSPPAWIPNFNYETDPAKVKVNVLAGAGSRPLDRSALDQELVDGLAQNDNLVVECVYGCPRAAGPWPNWTPQYRPLDLPANPNGDADLDGYTNLEEWLHAYARAVETGEGDYVWDLARNANQGAAPIIMALDSGLNTLEMAVREPGLAIDKLLLSGDGIMPEGLGLTGFSCDTFIQTDNTFPIELLSFDAVPDLAARKVRLSWSTGMEENNEKFVLERSEDGFWFRPFAELASQGDGTQVRHYGHFDDQPVMGRSYYRLRQVDTDGKYEVFSPVEVNFERDLGLKARVYPNPVAQYERLNASVWLEEEEEVRFALFNALGQQVWSASNQRGQIGWNEFQFDWSALNRGVYVLKIGAGQNRQGGIMVQRVWLR